MAKSCSLKLDGGGDESLFLANFSISSNSAYSSSSFTGSINEVDRLETISNMTNKLQEKNE